MGLRAKSRTRLVVLTVAVAGAVAVLGGGYGGMKWYRTKQARLGKPLGLEAYKAGEWVAALHYLGPYVQRWGDDPEVLAAYAKVRAQLPEPGGAHIAMAVAPYRRLAALEPGNLEHKRKLAKLYGEMGMRTESVQVADDIIEQVTAGLEKAYPGVAAGAKAAAAIGPAGGEEGGLVRARTAVSILAGLRQQKSETPEVRAQSIEALAQALKLKIVVMRSMRKMVEAQALSALLEQMDPGADAWGEELEIMRINGESKGAIVARMEALTGAALNDPAVLILRARVYLNCDLPEKARNEARAAVKAVLADLPKAAGQEDDERDLMVLGLVRTMDQLEMFDEANEALAGARAVRGKAAGNVLEEEYFRRLIYREQYEAAATELAKVEVAKRPLLAGMRAVALCGWARKLEGAGKSAEGQSKRQDAEGLLKVLEECDKRWDSRAGGWMDVLTLSYFAKDGRERKVSEAKVIEKLSQAASRDPGNPFFHMSLGNAYQAGGEPVSAMQEWELARELAPSWADPCLRESRYFSGMGEIAAANAFARAADVRRPNQRETLVAMALSWCAKPGQTESQAEADLLAFIAAQRDTLGMDETVLPREVALLAKGSKDRALARVGEAVTGATKENGSVLPLLAMACRQLKLGEGVDKLCLDTYERLLGVTERLAAVKCRMLIEDNAPAAAVKRQYEDLRKGAGAGANTLEWDLGWCQLLEAVKDAGARDAWQGLIKAHREDVRVMWAALGAGSVRGDRGLSRQVLEELKGLNGGTGLSWRMEMANWLLEEKTRDSQEQAVKIMTQAVTSSSQNPEARKMLARAYLALGNAAAAAGELAEAANLKPEDLETKLSLAALYQQQRETVRAVEQLKRVAAAKNATETQKTRAGVMLSQLGETALAATLLEGAGNAQAGQVLPLLYWERGDLPRAREGYLKLLGLETKDGKVVAAEGAAAPPGEMLEQALQFFATMGLKAEAQAALAVMDKMELAGPIKRAIRGTYLSRVQDYDGALVELNAAAKGDPKNPMIWRSLLLTQLSAGKIDDAVATAQQAEAKAALADNGARMSLEKLGKGSPVLRDIDVLGYLVSCLNNPDQSRGVTEVFATLQTNGGDARKLAADLRIVADRHTDAIGLQVLATRKLILAGMMDDALSISRRAMLIDPAATQPAKLTTLCLAEMGRWDDALPAARAWKKLAPGSLEPDVVIATAYVKLAQPLEAVRALQPYVDLFAREKTLAAPENRFVVYQYAMALAQAGQTPQVEALIWPLVESDKSWREDWTRLATDYLKPAQQATAESWLKKLAAKTEEQDLEGRMIIAVAWNRLGKNFNSNDAWQEAYRMSVAASDQAGAAPDMRARAALVAGGMLGSINDLTHAEEMYRKSLKLDPKRHEAANNLAMILTKAFRLDDAEDAAKQAIAGSPESATYYDTLAAVLKAKKKWADALAAIDTAISKEPRNPEWLIAKAEILTAAAAAGGGASKPDLSDVRLRMEQLHVDLTRAPELKRRYDALPK